jgi:hypothetical protein
MDKCTANSARSAIAKFGANLVKEARHEILQHFTPGMIDEMSDMILEKAPDSFLDKAMQRRLETIDARPLLNMLARAERLGYDARDITPDEPSASRATEPPQNTVPSQPSYSVAAPPPVAAEPAIATHPMACPWCSRVFNSISARDHVSVSSALPPGVWEANRYPAY